MACVRARLRRTTVTRHSLAWPRRATTPFLGDDGMACSTAKVVNWLPTAADGTAHHTTQRRHTSIESYVSALMNRRRFYPSIPPNCKRPAPPFVLSLEDWLDAGSIVRRGPRGARCGRSAADATNLRPRCLEVGGGWRRWARRMWAIGVWHGMKWIRSASVPEGRTSQAAACGNPPADHPRFGCRRLGRSGLCATGRMRCGDAHVLIAGVFRGAAPPPHHPTPTLATWPPSPP